MMSATATATMHVILLAFLSLAGHCDLAHREHKRSRFVINCAANTTHDMQERTRHLGTLR